MEMQSINKVLPASAERIRRYSEALDDVKIEENPTLERINEIVQGIEAENHAHSKDFVREFELKVLTSGALQGNGAMVPFVAASFIPVIGALAPWITIPVLGGLWFTGFHTGVQYTGPKIAFDKLKDHVAVQDYQDSLNYHALKMVLLEIWKHEDPIADQVPCAISMEAMEDFLMAEDGRVYDKPIFMDHAKREQKIGDGVVRSPYNRTPVKPENCVPYWPLYAMRYLRWAAIIEEDMENVSREFPLCRSLRDAFVLLKWQHQETLKISSQLRHDLRREAAANQPDSIWFTQPIYSSWKKGEKAARWYDGFGGVDPRHYKD